jgi:iron complex transport system ATP-binding protein
MSDFHLKNVSFHYREQDRFSIKGLSLSIPEGKITSIIGPNGSGKTTLLKILARLLEPKRGTILLKGKNFYGYSNNQLSKMISFLPQKESQNLEMEIGEYILIGRAPYIPIWQLPSLKDRQIVNAMIERFHYQHLKHMSINQVSGGEFQKIRLLRVIVQQTAILLLDEPTSHLDIMKSVFTKSNIESLYNIPLEIIQVNGKTVLLK